MDLAETPVILIQSVDKPRMTPLRVNINRLKPYFPRLLEARIPSGEGRCVAITGNDNGKNDNEDTTNTSTIKSPSGQSVREPEPEAVRNHSYNVRPRKTHK